MSEKITDHEFVPGRDGLCAERVIKVMHASMDTEPNEMGPCGQPRSAHAPQPQPDERARLVAKLRHEHWRRGFGCRCGDQWPCDALAAAAMLEADGRDTARLDWLCGSTDTQFQAVQDHWLVNDDVRAAIDAAIAAQSQSSEEKP